VAHFACHGISDQDDPAGSRLLLHDHASRPLDVTAISRLHLKADLAFLSACSTTQTSPRLVDEAVHITAAFQLAGYGNVVGTLWPVYEHAAALIADDVYTDLTGDGAQPPETRRTALALHHAVRRLRADHPDDPAVWAAHIHAGI
jgi:CHAT domain-containing protein